MSISGDVFIRTLVKGLRVEDKSLEKKVVASSTLCALTDVSRVCLTSLRDGESVKSAGASLTSATKDRLFLPSHLLLRRKFRFRG